MKNPKISIITSTLNAQKYLDLCLKSVEGQTYRNIEHIFVDGYSTDATLKKIKEYLKRNPQTPTKLIQSAPRGIANAMNIGIKNASGDIIHFLHADDYYFDKKALERVVGYFSSNPKINLIIGNWVLRFGKKTIHFQSPLPMKRFSKYMMKLPMIIHHENTFVKKKLFEKYGLFDETIKVCMDTDFCFRISNYEKPLVVDDQFTVFIVHRGSYSSNPMHLSLACKDYLKLWAKNSKIAKG